jgi:ABC-type arginine transport system permease subunit
MKKSRNYGRGEISPPKNRGETGAPKALGPVILFFGVTDVFKNAQKAPKRMQVNCIKINLNYLTSSICCGKIQGAYFGKKCCVARHAEPI